MRRNVLIAVLMFTLTSVCIGDSSLFRAIDESKLDKAVFVQWVDGKEIPVSEEQAKGGPQAVVWTVNKKPDWRGIKFAEGRNPEIRHLRIGFTEKVIVGSVLVRGGGVLSILKSDVAYPGDLADDSQWIKAERLLEGQVSQKEVGNEEYAIWVLPKGMQTRALRFSHQPAPGDREIAGWLGGVWINKQRLVNTAPQALAQSAARDDVSAKLIDESNNGTWATWSNGEQGAAIRVSQEHPEIITLTSPRPVTLSGICLLWTGFSEVEIDAFTGGENENIREAEDSNWQKVGSQGDMDALYPMALGPHWIAFDKPAKTQALRLRITSGSKSNHEHLRDKVKEGRRVWLGELMAIAPLNNDTAIASLILPRTIEEPPPIGIKFSLPEAGLVTLVIEDMQNKRVRNLVSETPFDAGENIGWWDGSDDLLRDPEAATHGLYHIPTRFVEPGTYKVRGLCHKPLKLHYEFSIYNAGKPAWTTVDNTGCWLTTHSPPTSIAAVPGNRTADGKPLIFIGAYVAEGGHGLQWLYEDGVKIGGQHWVGGIWTGAETLTANSGEKAVPNHLCYIGSVWEGELRLTAKTRSFEDDPVFKKKLGDDPRDPKENAPKVLEGFNGGDKVYVLAGIAAHNGLIVCSMTRQNELIVVDVKAGEITSRIATDNPRGVTFDAQGRLLSLSGSKLLRYATLSAQPEAIISQGLEDPHHVTVDEKGNFYITDRGNSHQVKIFSPSGRLIGKIGKPGAPAVGPYDPLHINNPNELTVDSLGHVWVAESDNYPRRVSVWSAKGELLRTFYGPTEYGGGGVLDPEDPSRFYYKGMEFKLDWKSGTDSLVRVFARPNPLLAAHYGHYSPDTPLYPTSQNANRYFTSCYTHCPTNGDDVTFIWLDGKNQARLVAGFGDAHSWDVLREPEFHSFWPSGTKPQEQWARRDDSVAFAWTDTNGDGRPQPAEVQFVKAYCRGITVMNDLSVVAFEFDDENVRFDAIFDDKGLPHYDLLKPESLGPAGGQQPSSGGKQSLTEPGGWTITTNASEPFSPYGLGGRFKGEPRWSYPSAWPGLHASHEAAVPDHPGMVVGHTRLLGGWIQGRTGPMFCINGNMGNMYLLTADGLFVSTLFHDIRLRPNWAAPLAIRNMDVTDVSLHDENFWPSITQTKDGRVFLVDGGRTSLVRIDGLETLQYIPEQTITVSHNDLLRAQNWFTKIEVQRQQQRGSGILSVSLRKSGPNVDGTLDDWPAATDWAFIDRRGTKANFNSDSKPYEVSAAVTLTQTHLYAAWRTTEKDLLNSIGQTPNALFKHGGCLDIMLATDNNAKSDRTMCVPGDQRLLITQVEGKTRALIYRAKVPGVKEPVAFSSPWRTITIDAVEDVSSQVILATDGAGIFEIGVPLDVLHWQPKSGEIYKADIGVLRGSNGHTTQRVYWTNKATAITADVPSEAELTPRLWGKWRIVEQ